MAEMENNIINEAVATADENVNVIEATDDLGAMFNEEDELASLFASDIEAIEEDAAISEDLEGFAKGFPDWDLHPPMK